MATFIPNVTDVFPEPSLFTPDFSYMDKMLRRRQDLYDQGFAQVSSKYDFVNKELTNPTNTKSRDIFLKQAKDNLKNLSGMDLSEAQNVESAKGVFEPWVNNTNALWDATLTDHWKKQEQMADGYRHEDGGKYFNQANLDYVKKQRMAFAKDDADNWKGYYDNRRSYTEYYDYQKEIQELMKSFKPSSYKIDRVSGLYKFTDEKASWTDAEIRKYLNANLSDKAKQQMKIEGDVKYNNDPQQLGQIYMAQAQNKVAQFDAGIELADKQLSSETDKDKIAQIKEYKQALQDRKAALNNTITTIKGGDYSLIKKRGEEIAADLYIGETMSKISNGFSHADVTHKISGDDVGLAIYNQQAQDRRQQRGFEHDERMAMLKGEIAPPPQLTTIQTEDVENAATVESIQQEAEKYREENVNLEQVNKGMVLAWMQEKNPANKNLTIKDVSSDDIKKYINTGFNGKPLPPGHMYNLNLNKMFDNERSSIIVLNKINQARDRVVAGYNAEDKRTIQQLDQTVAAIGDVTLDDGTKISSKALYDGVRNGSIKIEGSQSGGEAAYAINMNGKAVTAYNSRGTVKNKDLVRALNVITKVQDNKVYKKLNNDVTDYVEKNSKDLVLTADVMAFSEKSAERTTLENEMSSIFPKANYDIQAAGIGSGVDNQGTAYFFITGKSDDAIKDSDDIAGYLNQRGYKDVVARKTQTGTIYEIKNYNSPVTQAYKQFNNSERLVVHELKTISSDVGTYTSGQYLSNSKRKLQLKKDHGYYYLMVEGLDGGNTMDRYDQPFADPADAAMMGQKLTATVGGVPEALLQNYFQINQ